MKTNIYKNILVLQK